MYVKTLNKIQITSAEKLQMSHKLLGRNVDDVLIEFYGPHTGRNYFETTVAPQLSVLLSSATPGDTIVIEKNTTLEMVGTNNSNAIGSTPVRGGKLMPTRTPGDWATLATIVAGDPLTVVALLAEDFEHGIRVRITVKSLGVLGPGGVEVATQWN
jgi:hypothetical protein